MSETYYIDGYNLLHHVSHWKELAEHNLEEARKALVDDVSKWCSATDHTAKVIFDGSGLRTETSALPSPAWGVEVLYASRHTSADAIIERGVYDAADRESIVVVSADRGILDLCRGMGAMSMRPEYFLRAMAEASAGLSANLLRRQSRGNLGSVEDGLGAAEKEGLHKLRRRLDK
ncbi:MAG: NYN domain-containing protein [Candidatus Hydrogenedentes bacterium]|nr:NYN domain-containing protein [Candidatus Hydrogenedentota bacterium]